MLGDNRGCNFTLVGPLVLFLGLFSFDYHLFLIPACRRYCDHHHGQSKEEKSSIKGHKKSGRSTEQSSAQYEPR